MNATQIPDRVRALIKADDEVYVHPQGSTIIVSNGRVLKYRPNGKCAESSATARSLQEGHGRWMRVYSVGASWAAPDKPASNDVDDVLAWLDGRSATEGWGANDR